MHKNTQSIWRDDIPQSTNPLRFLLAMSRPHKLWAVLAIGTVLLAASGTAFIPYMLKQIVDAATALATGGTARELIIAASIYVGISLGLNLLWRVSGFFGARWALGVRATGRFALSSYATLHSHQYFSDRFAGSLSSKIGHAANGVRSLVANILWGFLDSLVSVVAGFAIVFITSPAIGFVFLAWVLLLVPLNVWLVRKRVPLSEDTQRTETALNGVTVDMLTNISAVHEYARRSFELERLKGFITRRRLSGLRNWTFGEIILTLNNILQALFVGGMIVGAVVFLTKGIITVGDVVLVITVIILMEHRLTFIGGQLNEFAENWGTIKEGLLDILIEHDVTDRQDAKVLAEPGGDILFKGISFNYGGASVFESLTLSIPAGQRVGLVGKSGAGKSTLIKLLLRHYDLASGHIIVGGEDIATITKESLRRAIAIVPQEPLLFHRSIKENISYGAERAHDADIERAARLAQAHEFITALPHGYESLVGERGVKLSGGQRQRVAIARALLKNAPILVLDEATSSLDSESEKDVQKALLNLMEGRTVIAIAHRLSTLRAMDRIIVLDNGRIVESGTHNELLSKKGIYASLWEHQAGGFLPEEG